MLSPEEQLKDAINTLDTNKVEVLLARYSINLDYRYQTKSMDKELTHLQHAAAMGDVEIIKILLKHGANPKAKSGFGRSPLSIAAFYGNLEACEILLPRSDIGSKDKSFLTAYFNAQKGFNKAPDENRKKRFLAIKELLRLDTYYYALQQNDDTLLFILGKDGVDHAKAFFIACTNNSDLEIVRKMLEKKCVDINAYYNGKTGLHCASACGQKEIVYELLKHEDIDINARSIAPITKEENTEHIGLTALHFACMSVEKSRSVPSIKKITGYQSSRVDIAEKLIERGANLNAKDREGMTPLHRAIFFNDLDLVSLLVINGSDLKVVIQTPDKPQGMTLLQFASNYPEITAFLNDASQEHYNSGSEQFPKDNQDQSRLKTKSLQFFSDSTSVSANSHLDEGSAKCFKNLTLK